MTLSSQLLITAKISLLNRILLTLLHWNIVQNQSSLQAVLPNQRIWLGIILLISTHCLPLHIPRKLGRYSPLSPVLIQFFHQHSPETVCVLSHSHQFPEIMPSELPGLIRLSLLLQLHHHLLLPDPAFLYLYHILRLTCSLLATSPMSCPRYQEEAHASQIALSSTEVVLFGIRSAVKKKRRRTRNDHARSDRHLFR